MFCWFNLFCPNRLICNCFEGSAASLRLDRLLPGGSRKSEGVLTRSCWILILTWWALLLALSMRSSSDGDGFFKCSSIRACGSDKALPGYQQISEIYRRNGDMESLAGCAWTNIPAVQPLPAPASSWVSELHVFALLDPINWGKCFSYE